MGRIVDDLIAFPQEAEPEATEASFSAAGLSVVAADFGESKASGTTVQTSVGVVMVDRTPATRTITLKLEVRPDADVTLPQAAARLEAIVGEMMARDTWLRRDFHVGGDFGSILYHVSGEVSLADFAGWQVGASPDVTLTMVCDFAAYSTEDVEHGPFETSAGQRQLVYELPASGGSARGLKRTQVTNEGADDWRGLIWSEESRYYKPGDPTAEPVYLAKNLTPKGGAEVKTVSGAEVVQHLALTAGRLAVLGSEIKGVGHMTHRGPRRMWMRLEQPSGAVGDVKLQLLWRPLGSSRWVEDNPIVSPYVVGGYCLLDLGECRPQDPVLGDDRWESELIAWAPGGSGSIRIRDVYPLSTEQYLKCSEPYSRPLADSQTAKKVPSTVSNLAGAGTKEWKETSKVAASDNVRATVVPHGVENPSSQYLAASNFGFSLPGAADVVELIAEVEVRALAKGWVADSSINPPGFVIGGVFHPVDRYLEPWPTTDSIRSYRLGASSLVQIDPADVENSGFSFHFAAMVVVNGETQAEVDLIRVHALYTSVSSENAVCFAGRSIELASDGPRRQSRSNDAWGTTIPDGFLPHDAGGDLPSRAILIPTEGDLVATPDGAATPQLSATDAVRAGHLYARAAAV